MRPPRLLAALCALTLISAATAEAASTPFPAVAQPITATQQHYLALAEAGVAKAQAGWHDSKLGWYDARLHDRDRYPLATIWDIVPLFQSLDAIAIASPTATHRAAVKRFAAGAEHYLNRGLRPLPGYSPYPGDREPGTETWFDDNGWWGLAFINAFRATGSRRYLLDAERALAYIARAGWDARGGGIWWNTTRPYKSGPALASDTLLATLLYQLTGSAFDLAQAQRFLAWGNSSSGGFSSADGLYAGSSTNPTPVDYIEGPLIYAQASLCRLRSEASECVLANRLKDTAMRRFGYLLDFSPQYDAIYLQWMLALYGLEGDPTLYRMAVDNARNVQMRAANAQSLYLLSWNGRTLPRANAVPGMLQTHAASTSLLAWLAVYRPPGS